MVNALLVQQDSLQNLLVVIVVDDLEEVLVIILSILET